MTDTEKNTVMLLGRIESLEKALCDLILVMGFPQEGKTLTDVIEEWTQRNTAIAEEFRK